MNTNGKRSTIMLVLLGIAIFIHTLGLGIFYALGLEPLPSFEFLYSGIFICAVVWWLRAETRNSPVTQVYCAGLLVGAAWPVIIPYHLFKTRGVLGLLPLFALIGAYVFGWLLSTVIYLVAFYSF